jgi:8-oxo-dGTP pyrophosphatase MutT (NUDIX family)
MTFHSIDPEIHVRRWGELVSLLSMDVVRPFYDLMGLRPGEPDELQRVLQEIVSGRKRLVEAPDVAQGIVRAVEEELGAQASRHLFWWERHVFHNDPGDNLHLDEWDNFLRCCRHDPDLWKRLFPDQIREEALDRFRRSLNIDEYQRRQDDVDSRPLSDWDLHLYALNLYDDNLYDDAFPAPVPHGPRVWVKPTVRDYQGYVFWAWVLRTLRPDQLDRLWQAGKRIVLDEELTSVKSLLHPSVLEIAL